MNGLEQLVRTSTEHERDRRYRSVVTARVTHIQDDGLYQVQYLAAVDPTVQFDVRVMGAMAGGGRGAYLMPEVGDEVVVAFEDGDPNQPIILGGVWNSEAQPPGQARPSPDNDIRTIVSRSGHELTFDDTPGSAKVTLRSAGGPEVVLDGTTATVRAGTAQIEIGPGGELRISGLSITLDAATIALQGALTINGVPYTLHIHSGGTIGPPGVTGPVQGVP